MLCRNVNGFPKTTFPAPKAKNALGGFCGSDQQCLLKCKGHFFQAHETVMCSYFRRVWCFFGPHQHPMYKCCVFCYLLYIFDQIFIFQDVLPFDRHGRNSTMWRKHTVVIIYASWHFSLFKWQPDSYKKYGFSGTYRFSDTWHCFTADFIIKRLYQKLHDNIKFILLNFCIKKHTHLSLLGLCTGEKREVT